MLTTAALAAVPLFTLLVLAASGQLRAGPAVIVAVLDVLAAAYFARLRRREHRLVVEAVRNAADANPTSSNIPKRLNGDLGRALRLFADRSDSSASQLRTEEAIVESLPDPLIVLGADRAVLRANAAANAAYGAEMPAVLRHPLLRAAIDRVQTMGVPQNADLLLPVPVTREVHATVFRLAGGRVAAVLSDRTRERALERMRADFVANASHELRTPLASLMGFIDTLRGPAADDPPAQARFLAIMAEQAQRMNRLIDDLLSLSRIELTEHQTPTDEVVLEELIRFTAASFEPRVNTKGIHLDIHVPEDLPAIQGDEDQLGQVLTNLLDNAIKYGREAAPCEWLPRPCHLAAAGHRGTA